MTREHAYKLREMMHKAAASLDDKDASTAPELFPRLKYDGSLIRYQTRINWNGVVKMSAVDLWDTEANNPDNAPTLWNDIKYRDGIRIIPEVITAAEMFSKGEQGWWGDDLYESLIDANVYTPEQYPQGWKKIG